PTRVVDLPLAPAALGPLEGVELELTGRVVAGVADDAAPIEDRLHVLEKTDRPRPGLDLDGRERRRARGRCEEQRRQEQREPEHGDLESDRTPRVGSSLAIHGAEPSSPSVPWPRERAADR